MNKSNLLTHTLCLEKLTRTASNAPGRMIARKDRPASLGQNRDSGIEKRTPTYAAWRDELKDFDRLVIEQSQAYHRAEALYRTVRFAGQLSILFSWLAGSPNHLIDASHLLSGSVDACQEEGLQIVPIQRIVASQEHSHSFDLAFNPLQDRDRSRWTDIAALRLLGDELPPVDLIRVQQAYIVRDGHQRISVACALGQEDIEANVMLVI